MILPPSGRGIALMAPVALFAMPLALALPVALAQAVDAAAWRALLADPQLPRALALSIGSAIVSTALALALCMAIVTHLHGTPLWPRLARALGPMLALPHAAFAIGLALLVMPAGVIARLAGTAGRLGSAAGLAHRQRPSRGRPDRGTGRQGAAVPAVERRRAAGATRHRHSAARLAGQRRDARL